MWSATEELELDVCIQQLLVCEPSRRALGKPHFVNLIRYTQQGIAKIKESPARLGAAKRTAEKAGGKIHAVLAHGTVRRCDNL